MNVDAPPSLLEGLIERLQSREDLELEYKLAEGGLPQSLWETVSAFANTEGGWIILGVDESDEEPRVVGVRKPHAKLKTFFDVLRNKQKVSQPVCGAHDAKIESLDGTEVIVIRVAAVPRNARPVYINGNPMTGTYVRRNEGDYNCTESEVRRMFREASDTSIDSSVLPNYTIEDLDVESIARYRRRFQTENPAHTWNAYETIDFLRALGAYGTDRETNQSGITVAGLLMFGQDIAIRQWRKRHLIDFRDQRHLNDPSARWSDREAWNGNLFGAFEQIYPRLTRDLPRPFRLRSGLRVDEGPEHEAMREALVNLLVHADYTETDASLIIRSDEGVLFRNPGSSRIPEVDLVTGRGGRDRSDPRNPYLLTMFRLTGFADEAGTGMPKIVQAWKELGFQHPAIKIASERYEFSLDLRYVHLISDNARAWLATLGDSWSEAEQLALVLARYEGDVDNVSLRLLTGQHPTDTTKTLRGLRDRGLLQKVGGKRGPKYVLSFAAQDQVASVFPSSGDTDELTEPGNLEGEPGKSDNKPGEFGQEPGEQGSELPTFAIDARQVWSQLERIAEPARGRAHLDAAVRDDLIVHLCTIAALSTKQLATLVSRSPAYVQSVVSPLIVSGRLVYLYPRSPNHPRQRYVAANSTPNPVEGAPV